jgi:hypothetical protein
MSERPTVSRPSRGAFEPVDRLLEGVVAVRCRHLAVGGNEALEDARASVRVGGLDQEPHAQGSHLNHFRGWGHPASSPMVRGPRASVATLPLPYAERHAFFADPCDPVRLHPEVPGDAERSSFGFRFTGACNSKYRD